MPGRCVAANASLALAALLLLPHAVAAQFGIVLSGTGPINRSMGGAATAMPLDAAGALYWNPATLSGLPHSELEFGLELLYPQTRLASAVAAQALGPGTPPIPLAGSDAGDNGIAPLPTVGFAYRPEDSPWSSGLGLFLVGGFAVNYPASVTNPLLTPQPPDGLGLGATTAELQVYQLVPSVAYQLTPRLAVGFAPTLNLVRLVADPLFLVPPDDADGDGFATFPPGTHSRMHWGLGFQTGLYGVTDVGLTWGVSFKSPQWLETFRYQSRNERGRPQTAKVRFDYPLIVSVGTGYTGLPGWVFAADLRYLDYRNTKGFSRSGLDPSGAVRGLGWDSVLAVAAGAQYQATERLALRLGYTYNTSPIDEATAAFNVASPLILQHTLYAGASWRMAEAVLVSLAYAHAYANHVAGPLQSPLGPLPRTLVQSTVSADTLMLGVTVGF